MITTERRALLIIRKDTSKKIRQMQSCHILFQHAFTVFSKPVHLFLCLPGSTVPVYPDNFFKNEMPKSKHMLIWLYVKN